MQIIAMAGGKKEQKTTKELVLQVLLSDLIPKKEEIIKNPDMTEEMFQKTPFYQELEKISKSKELKNFIEEQNKRQDNENPLNRIQDKLPDFKTLLNLQFVEISWFLDSDASKYLGWSGIEKQDFVNYFSTIKFINPYTERENCFMGSDLSKIIKYLTFQCQFKNLLPGHMYIYGTWSGKTGIKTHVAPTSHHGEITIDDQKIAIKEQNLIIFLNDSVNMNDIFEYKNSEIFLKEEIVVLLRNRVGMYNFDKQDDKVILKNFL